MPQILEFEQYENPSGELIKKASILSCNGKRKLNIFIAYATPQPTIWLQSLQKLPLTTPPEATDIQLLATPSTPTPPSSPAPRRAPSRGLPYWRSYSVVVVPSIGAGILSTAAATVPETVEQPDWVGTDNCITLTFDEFLEVLERKISIDIALTNCYPFSEYRRKSITVRVGSSSNINNEAPYSVTIEKPTVRQVGFGSRSIKLTLAEWRCLTSAPNLAQLDALIAPYQHASA